MQSVIIYLEMGTMIMLKNIIFLNKPKDLTNLLEFVKTLVIIEINGANFAHIFF